MFFRIWLAKGHHYHHSPRTVGYNRQIHPILAYMVFPHLLLRWLWRPMIGHEKAFFHGKLFPGKKTGGPVHLPVPRPFKPFEGLPVQTVPA